MAARMHNATMKRKEAHERPKGLSMESYGLVLSKGSRQERTTASKRCPGERYAYFLCRCRLSSLRCLCLRIFLRRFLITLPNGFLPCSAEPGSFSERAMV